MKEVNKKKKKKEEEGEEEEEEDGSIRGYINVLRIVRAKSDYYPVFNINTVSCCHHKA